MKSLPYNAFERFLPNAETLWEAANAERVSVEVDPGRTVDIPLFHPAVTNLSIRQEVFETRSHRRIGTQALCDVEVDGIGYRSRVLLPDDTPTSRDITVVDSTAWTTTIDGYVGDRDAKIVIDNHVPLIAIGPPHSDSGSPIDEISRIPRVVRDARQASLAYNAEVEQLIVASLCDEFGLENRQLKLGDSRGANITPAQVAYAPRYDGEVVAFDTKGRCAPDKIQLQHIPEVARWLTTTVMAGVAVSGCLLASGRHDLLVGTFSLKPGFLASSLTGVMRSLASGETGQMIDWVPHATHGHDVIYGRDSLAHPSQLEELWQDHPHVARKIVASGTHASLLHPLAHSSQRARIARLISEYRSQNGQVAGMDWNAIYAKSGNNGARPIAA